MYKGRPERIVATIEARMTSTRLPGKVLLPINGIPALMMQVQRVKRSRYLDAICIATTVNAADDPLVELARELGTESFRGSEDDVLGRVLGAAQACKADIIVELTGDCPFTDPALVDRGIEEFFSGQYDYSANTLQPSYPNGFDVQVFPTSVLEEAAGLTNDTIDRAHVSYFIYKHPELYRLHNWSAKREEYGPDLRITLDEKDDHKALIALAAGIGGDTFTAAAAVTYLRAHPTIAAMNAHVRQKEVEEL